MAYLSGRELWPVTRDCNYLPNVQVDDYLAVAYRWQGGGAPDRT